MRIHEEEKMEEEEEFIMNINMILPTQQQHHAGATTKSSALLPSISKNTHSIVVASHLRNVKPRHTSCLDDKHLMLGGITSSPNIEKDLPSRKIRNSEVLSFIKNLKKEMRALEQGDKALENKFNRMNGCNRDHPNQQVAVVGAGSVNGQCSSSMVVVRKESQKHKDEQDMNKWIKEIEELRKERNALRKQCQEQLKTIDELKQGNKAIQLECEEIKANAERNRTVHENEIKKTKLELAALQNAHAEMEETIRNQVETIEQLTRENDMLHVQGQSLSMDLDNSERRYKTLSNSVGRLTEQKHHYVLQVEDLQQTMESYALMTQTQAVSIEMMRKEIAKKDKENKIVWRKLTSTVEEYEDEKERFLAKCTALRYSYDMLLQEKHEFESEMTSLQEQLQQMNNISSSCSCQQDSYFDQCLFDSAMAAAARTNE